MIYTPMTKKAIKLMYEKHKDQVDKSGMPYVCHPLHVAEQMKDENTTIVGLLHDIVEDTDVTLEELAKIGFSREVVEAIATMTHDPSVDYYDYVKEIGKNPISRKVKLADLEHNIDLTRLNQITEWDLARVEKYKKCHDYLEQVEMLDELEHANNRKMA